MNTPGIICFIRSLFSQNPGDAHSNRHLPHDRLRSSRNNSGLVLDFSQLLAIHPHCDIMTGMVWLDEFDATVLFRLWKHREDGFGTLVRSKDLRDMLGPTTPAAPSRQQVVRSLDKMKNGGLLEWEKVAAARQSGPIPAGFRISSGKLMTRPATAVMLFEIHSDPTPPTSESAVMASLLQGGYRHKGNEITEAYLKDQVSFCITQGYLEESSSGDNPQFYLKSTTRVDAEILFIDKLRRFAQVSRVLWSATATERFERKDESIAFNEFLTDLNLLAADEFANWLNYAVTELTPPAGTVVEFKAGARLSVIANLKASLSDFRK